MNKNNKIINFLNRTYAQLIAAYTNLKSRYRRTVSMKLIPIGAGLYRGYFKII